MTNYEQYLKTQYWWDLNYRYLTCNEKARCFVCGNKYTLLLHHCNYRALHKEKLNKDIYILCFDCHELVHFWFFRLIKVPLTQNTLLFSMRMRRVLNCLNMGSLVQAGFWFVISLSIGSFYLIVFTLKWVLDKLVKLVLKLN